jgi:hypothetical protein
LYVGQSETQGQTKKGNALVTFPATIGRSASSVLAELQRGDDKGANASVTRGEREPGDDHGRHHEPGDR